MTKKNSRAHALRLLKEAVAVLEEGGNNTAGSNNNNNSGGGGGGKPVPPFVDTARASPRDGRRIGALSPERKRGGGGGGGEDEEFERVELYPHPPKPQTDYFDSIELDADIIETLRKNEFEGIFNLSTLLLVFSLAYNVVRSMMEHGNRIKLEPLMCNSFREDLYTAGKYHLVLTCYSIIFYSIVKRLIKTDFPKHILFSVYAAAQVIMMVGSATFIVYARLSPLIGMVLCVMTLIVTLKSHSYVATNHLLNMQNKRKLASAKANTSNGSGSSGNNNNSNNSNNKSATNGASHGKSSSSSSLTHRNNSNSNSNNNANDVDGSEEKRQKEEEEAIALAEAATQAAIQVAKEEGMSDIRGQSKFPSNVRILNYMYFMLLAPVLVYEPLYPRSKSFRLGYVMKKLCVASLMGFIMYTNFMQFMLPVLVRADLPWYYAVMKLAIPSFVAWLAGFYLLFGCFLNIVSEVSLFADRRFYMDWWNTTSLDSFWRKWNLPVHEWALRHVYVDMVNVFGLNRTAAMVATFFVSALLHEYVFFVGLNATSKIPWFFIGMIMQVPMIMLSRNFVGRRRGNLIMWWSLFSGQPLLELLYFREWFAHNTDLFCVRS